MMLHAVPARWFSKDYTLKGADLKPLLLDLSNWRESAEFEIGGVKYKLSRESLLGDFTLSSAGGSRARARKLSAWRSSFEIEAEGHTFKLKRASTWGRSFAVSRGGETVGVISPVSVWSRQAMIDLPTSWPLALRIFVFWLVVVIWNRDQAAAAT